MRIPFFDIDIYIDPGRMDDDHKTVYEGFAVGLPDGTEMGLVIVRVDETGSEMHYHNSTAETYIVLSGTLSVYRGDINSSVQLSTIGESMKIPPGTAHSARAVKDTAWFLVVSTPPWSEEDHHIYDGPPITH